MIPDNAPTGNRMSQAIAGVRQWLAGRLATPGQPLPLQRANLAQLARADAQLPALVAACPVAMHYLHLLGPLDWEHFPERDPRRPWPGTQPAPRAPYVAAYLVKLDQEKRYMSGLRRYLVEHPALVWVLGFPLVASETSPYCFDVERSVPSRKQLGRVLRKLPNPCLQFLLTGVVTALKHELPAEVNFGDAVSLDTKHILAWVQENNPKDYVRERYNPDKQPKGDRDCRLGCKRKRNRGASEGNGGESGDAAPVAAPNVMAKSASAPPAFVASSTPATPASDPKPASKAEVGEYYWGYASGVVATKVEGWGEFVLAELTQPFDQPDVSYFEPLMAQVERRLGFRPRFGAFDAAFDAFYVYEYFNDAAGFAAVPFVQRGRHGERRFSPDGVPLCAADLPMALQYRFRCNTTLIPHQRVHYVCPLRFPNITAEACPVQHEKWAKDGCATTIAASAGARLRYQWFL